MSLPRQVREAQERSAEMIKNIKAGESIAPVTAAEAENPQAQQPQQASEKPMGSVVNKDGIPASATQELPVVPVEALQVQSQPEVPPAVVEQPIADEAHTKLQKSYDSLQGRFNKLKAEKEVYEERFTVMQGQIVDLTTQLNILKSTQNIQPMVSDAGDLSMFTDEERNEFDEKTLNLVGRSVQQAKAKAESLVTPLQKKLEQQETELFVDRIRVRVPEFDEINKDADFVEWLEATQDGNSGFTKIQTLQMAFDGRKVERVGKFFDEWKEMQKGKNPTAPTTNIASRVSPSKANLSPAPVIQKRIYSAKEYLQIGKDLTSGKYSAKDVQGIKQEMDLAVKEGRIQG